MQPLTRIVVGARVVVGGILVALRGATVLFWPLRGGAVVGPGVHAAMTSASRMAAARRPCMTRLLSVPRFANSHSLLARFTTRL